MKLSLLSSLLVSQALAFSPQAPACSSSATALSLFGGGGNKDGKKAGGGMMDQLAMFKKAQEVAKKKQQLDEELKQMTFEGSAADGKVKGTFKYVPVINPMDPNPDYEATKFDFDDEFFESSTPEELGEAVSAAIADGIQKTNEAVAEKYAVLQTDLMAAFGQKEE